MLQLNWTKLHAVQVSYIIFPLFLKVVHNSHFPRNIGSSPGDCMYRISRHRACISKQYSILGCPTDAENLLSEFLLLLQKPEKANRSKIG